MKTMKFFALLVGAISLFLTSCDSQNSAPKDASSIGSITMNRTSPISTGQTIVLSVPVEVNATDNGSVIWYYADTESQLIGVSSSSNGVYSLSMNWGSYGTYSFYAKYHYYFEGEWFSKSSPTATVTVKCAQLGNSLLGESFDQVSADNSGLTAFTGYDNIYYTLSTSSTTYYYFSNDVLASGFVYYTTTSSSDHAAFGYVSYLYVNNKSSMNTESVVYSVEYADGYTPTAEVEEAVAKFVAQEMTSSDDYAKVMNTALLAGEIISVQINGDMIDDSSVYKTMKVTYNSEKDSGDLFGYSCFVYTRSK